MEPVDGRRERRPAQPQVWLACRCRAEPPRPCRPARPADDRGADEVEGLPLGAGRLGQHGHRSPGSGNRRRWTGSASMPGGSTQDGAGWLAFMRGLVARGLSGVALVTSDDHAGLVNAIAAVLPGASWQRCCTHYAATCSPGCPRPPSRPQPAAGARLAADAYRHRLQGCTRLRLGDARGGRRRHPRRRAPVRGLGAAGPPSPLHRHRLLLPLLVPGPGHPGATGGSGVPQVEDRKKTSKPARTPPAWTRARSPPGPAGAPLRWSPTPSWPSPPHASTPRPGRAAPTRSG